MGTHARHVQRFITAHRYPASTTGSTSARPSPAEPGITRDADHAAISTEINGI
ncbi:hypothetical protein GIS00_15100 [Nakamurella sp. YIM 132087]|uniref:Uncharacterized protein n=1 Tax=Nakamurella alba TaxID=2665158 RepID=A0A7K1FMC5_9ACTN|nr:hypothetical protein [Nakamurella alba]MTD15268.1 hypothetical protein [Nakamurella alba]